MVNKDYDSVRNGNSQVAVSVTYPNNDVNGSGNFIESNLCIIFYNMHGYNQGFKSICGLINSYAPDIFLIQEHWLTPHNMSRFRSDFPEYYVFGSSAMERSVEIGPLSGRPVGGTAILVKNVYCLYVNVFAPRSALLLLK